MLWKNSIVFVWDGSNCASVAVSYSCSVNETTWIYSNSNNLLKDFSVKSLMPNLSLILCISLKEKQSLNILALSKNLFWLHLFCNIFGTNSLLGEIWSKYKQICCSFIRLLNLDVVFHWPHPFFSIRKFFVLLHDRIFYCFRKKNRWFFLPHSALLNLHLLTNICRWTTLIGSLKTCWNILNSLQPLRYT